MTALMARLEAAAVLSHRANQVIFAPTERFLSLQPLPKGASFVDCDRGSR